MKEYTNSEALRKEVLRKEQTKQVIETVTYFATHSALIALSVLECKLAMTNIGLSTIIATVVFIALASFEQVYGPLIGYDHRGFTSASLSCAFGQFINWLWLTSWPQDFEGFTVKIPLAIMFAVFGFIIQSIMLWEDLKD